LGRLGKAEEVAEAVIHLLGAPWTTGSELVIDGGLLLRE
jgi:NAD(P)-dependent dehydrogenase (short-subunit alcohol dehydrogenase family)